MTRASPIREAIDPLTTSGATVATQGAVGEGTRQLWQRFRRHKPAVISVAILVMLALSFVIGPVLSPYRTDELTQSIATGPSWSHPFGTDDIGRDLLVRTLDGGRFSLRIALSVAVLTTLIGGAIGAVSGYFGGKVDALLSQVTNLFLVVPSFVVLLVIANKWGTNPNTVAVLIAALIWPGVARVTRGVFMQLREQDFVLAARAGGAGSARIIIRHILPNCVGPLVVNLTLLIGIAVILESTLSFLGFGVRLPTPTLGNLVAEGKGALTSDPLRVLIPGSFVVTIVLCVNFIGDGLRDVFDPTTSALSSR